MYNSFKIVKLNSDYCDYLRSFDNRVAYNAGIKKLRPYIGVLFKINKIEYFAPLSSPKPKHKLMKNTIDLIKINSGEYGVINLNNMIPVTKNNYIELDLNKKVSSLNENKRINLIKNQLRWLTINKKEILEKSKRLYNLYINKKLPNNVVNRCCNFKTLEKACFEYSNN